MGKNGLNLSVPFFRIYWMGQVIEHIDRVRYQDSVTNRHQRTRPNPSALSDVAPGSDLDLSSMSKSRKLTPDYAVGTDSDAIAVARMLRIRAVRNSRTPGPRRQVARPSNRCR